MFSYYHKITTLVFFLNFIQNLILDLRREMKLHPIFFSFLTRKEQEKSSHTFSLEGRISQKGDKFTFCDGEHEIYCGFTKPALFMWKFGNPFIDLESENDVKVKCRPGLKRLADSKLVPVLEILSLKSIVKDTPKGKFLSSAPKIKKALNLLNISLKPQEKGCSTSASSPDKEEEKIPSNQECIPSSVSILKESVLSLEAEIDEALISLIGEEKGNDIEFPDSDSDGEIDKQMLVRRNIFKITDYEILKVLKQQSWLLNKMEKLPTKSKVQPDLPAELQEAIEIYTSSIHSLEEENIRILDHINRGKKHHQRKNTEEFLTPIHSSKHFQEDS